MHMWKLKAVESECDIIAHHKFPKRNNALPIDTSDLC